MKIRNVLALALLLPLMVACKAQDGSADVAPAAAPQTTAPAAAEQAPATEDVTAPADATATQEGDTPAPEPTPAPPAAAPAALQGPAPVEGEDYTTIAGGVPFAPVDGKVEVVEIFSYTCPACFRFQALVSSWKKTLPADVNFIYMHAAFGGPGDEYARAFYAAQTLGVLEKTHEPAYAAIHINNKLKGQRGGDSAEELAAFYATQGVDAKQFAATMKSFGVNAQLARSKQFAQRSQITGTPSVIVHGKYLVKGKTFEDMLRITDHLIARERAAQGR